MLASRLYGRGHLEPPAREAMDYAELFLTSLRALLRNKLRSILTVLGITIGIAAVICVVAIGNAGQARVAQQMNSSGR